MKFNNITIINGRVINGISNGKTQKFDEKKVEDGNAVDKIIVYSTFVDVNITVSKSANIEVHFYGEAVVDGDISFDSKLAGRELRVAVRASGNCYNVNLKLDISLPSKTFQVISVESMSGDITVGEKISCGHLELKTSSGDVNTEAVFKYTVVETMSGDVELYTEAQSDIDVKIKTMSGDVLTELNNIGHINLSTRTISGDVNNRHRIREGHIANVNISAMSGDIKIR